MYNNNNNNRECCTVFIGHARLLLLSLITLRTFVFHEQLSQKLHIHKNWGTQASDAKEKNNSEQPKYCDISALQSQFSPI